MNKYNRRRRSKHSEGELPEEELPEEDVLEEFLRELKEEELEEEPEYRSNAYLGWDFNTAIWEMAMKRYNLGQESTSLLNIMSDITSNHEYTFALE
ncbi:predicted protein [Sclerotinia sclerotiorum 1980 UF-70]|uniref:Uncharacterized protein n=2 Tax=Sclerotinia sclerotiorum (strain ATCC 18683 / 1980 / Ss-1) TaxID=665079 RepID=A7EQ65_SCLS1|nr:predicted protein [Sclerotinia sclerotiorum 1980 UF-70]APA10137.1 hypothetical protein sscle_06g049070 [Sclerotinia sclerotiorum 1980 UF-70]EDO04981.1 predicted protein [Sclerotinia sclerotiorum 1980 UF-70]